MKKNKMLRLASVLLVMTLLTTSIIGGTFAKYTSTGKVSDTARVAKWGVEIKTSGSLYSDAYAVAKTDDSDTSNLPIAWENDSKADSITVAAATVNDNIVAPGTKSYGDGLSFGITGKPEVAVEVKTTIKAEDIYLKAGTYGVLVPATVSDEHSLKKVMGDYSTDGVYSFKDNTYSKVTNGSKYEKDAKYYILTNKVQLDANYFPVEYTLGGETTDENAKTAVEVAKKLAEKIDSNTSKVNSDYNVTCEPSHTFAANTDLSNSGPALGNEKLTWEWKFESDEDGNKAKFNSADTFLGDMIAARNSTVDYVFVAISDAGAEALTISKTKDDYTVTKGKDDTKEVVANLQTKFAISLEVTQVD